MNKEKMIQWFLDRLGVVTYSMTNRLGPKSYDCSSAVYYAMIQGGVLPVGSMGNTETLFKLNGSVLKEITRKEVKRGDIFVSGTEGQSLGSGGHTGIFLSNSQFIHCSYYWNGIHIDSNDLYMGSRLKHRFFRIIDKESVVDNNNEPQKIELVVDGMFGNNTARRLQEIYNTQIKDGVISHQWKQEANKNVWCAEFDSSLIGSDIVRVIQKQLKINADGLMGSETVKSMQRKAGSTVDGVISPKSDLVRYIQIKLNYNEKPF